MSAAAYGNLASSRRSDGGEWAKIRAPGKTCSPLSKRLEQANGNLEIENLYVS